MSITFINFSHDFLVSTVTSLTVQRRNNIEVFNVFISFLNRIGYDTQFSRIVQTLTHLKGYSSHGPNNSWSHHGSPCLVCVAHKLFDPLLLLFCLLLLLPRKEIHEIIDGVLCLLAHVLETVVQVVLHVLSDDLFEIFSAIEMVDWLISVILGTLGRHCG